MFKFTLLFLAVFGTLAVLNARLGADGSFYIWMLHILRVARLLEFTTGMFVGLIFIEKSKHHTVNSTWLTSLEVIGLVAFILAVGFSVHLHAAIVRSMYYVPIWCLLIYTFAYQAGKVSKILSHKSFVYLGEISFSFYMTHLLVIRYFTYLHLNNTIHTIVCFLVSLLLSSLVYAFYEEPLRKLLRFGNYKKILKSVLYTQKISNPTP
ncbi:acyltransferase family protein [Paenibacillus roseipurpureus]|uniref:Acyltransferase 3 domain-containing protein n=1 Tax=Paenibacillus roseopurpureus TaxID=2918901 RepID=A0AA96LRU7_9BACL|nr:hypothetical protein [Paenibacillus sp. MBLB1832]WNR47147.1 hypothetical protein MJB10_23180 [Paenibacillus sp. MBLB1832]